MITRVIQRYKSLCISIWFFFSLLVAFGRLLLSLFQQNDSDFSYDRSYSQWTELYPFAHRYA